MGLSHSPNDHSWLDCHECLRIYDIGLEGEPDRERVVRHCICESCGNDQLPHRVFRFLNLTCDGRVWKL